MRDRGARKGRERATERARRAAEAWSERREGPASFRTRHGEVVLEDLTYRTDPDSGVAYVEVAVGGPAGGDPSFRVVNPPTLVEDPQGDVVAGGRRWREDPLAALAEAIGSNGGAMLPRRRPR